MQCFSWCLLVLQSLPLLNRCRCCCRSCRICRSLVPVCGSGVLGSAGVIVGVSGAGESCCSCSWRLPALRRCRLCILSLCIFSARVSCCGCWGVRGCGCGSDVGCSCGSDSGCVGVCRSDVVVVVIVVVGVVISVRGVSGGVGGVSGVDGGSGGGVAVVVVVGTAGTGGSIELL